MLKLSLNPFKPDKYSKPSKPNKKPSNNYNGKNNNYSQSSESTKRPERPQRPNTYGERENLSNKFMTDFIGMSNAEKNRAERQYEKAMKEFNLAIKQKKRQNERQNAKKNY